MLFNNLQTLGLRAVAILGVTGGSAVGLATVSPSYVASGTTPASCQAVAPMVSVDPTAPSATVGGAGCIYTAQGTQGSFVAVTPSSWQVSVYDPASGSAVVALGGPDVANPQNSGTFITKPGDVVSVFIFNTCAPMGEPCASSGFVNAGDVPGS
jgi:hypothetical protein